MTKRLVKYALPLAILLFAFLFALLFPLYRFIFDQDSIGYSAVAERVAAGEYYKSINGLWSPLSSWLVVPLIKAGIDPIIGFKYINGLSGVILLICTWHLLQKTTIFNWLKATILYTCVIVFLAYCFYELCADFLLLIFIVLYLIQIVSDDFFANKKRQLFCGIIATFGYLSKAYFFPFFIGHFIIVNYYLYQGSFAADKLKIFWRNIITGISTFFILSTPWIYALSKKYHYLTYSNAGKYNSYFHLHPGTEYKSLLLTPPYPDSYNSWDDPWLPFMQHFSPLSSASTIITQIKLFFINVGNSITYFTEISFLSLTIIAAVIFIGLSKKQQTKVPPLIFICLITAVMMPAGYLLFHLETRFIWILSILCLIMGGYLITSIHTHFQLEKKRLIFLSTFFVSSFVIGPILSLKNNIYNGKEAYTIADNLRSNKINGKIIANHLNPERYFTLLMSNVIAKNQFYNYSRGNFSTEEVKNAIKQYDIDYYMFSFNNNFEKECFLSSEIAKNATQIIDKFYPDIIVVKLK